MKNLIVIPCVALLLGAWLTHTLGSAPLGEGRQMTKKEKKNVETIRKLVQGFADGNLTQINDLVHEDFINHHAPEGMQDREGFRKIVEGASGAFLSFDSFSVKPTIIFAKGDHVAMMDIGEGMKNGQNYNHVDIHIFIMKDGKMYEHWNTFGLPSMSDNLTKFMQETTSAKH